MRRRSTTLKNISAAAVSLSHVHLRKGRLDEAVKWGKWAEQFETKVGIGPSRSVEKLKGLLHDGLEPDQTIGE